MPTMQLKFAGRIEFVGSPLYYFFCDSGMEASTSRPGFPVSGAKTLQNLRINCWELGMNPVTIDLLVNGAVVPGASVTLNTTGVKAVTLPTGFGQAVVDGDTVDLGVQMTGGPGGLFLGISATLEVV